jgi:glycosyltransferase involved in cell wall biosynthesis
LFVSVILSTYESPEWLTKVIWGYAAQTHRQFELLIADDGSSRTTAACIEQLRQATQLPLHHVWQAKQGFRKCRILNRAIRAAAADYLIFSDGDCIPRCDFLAQHVRLAAPGQFLSGGVLRLPRALSEQISSDDIFSGRITCPSWLITQGCLPNRKFLLLVRQRRLATVFDAITTTRPTLNGHNSSVWKQDVVRVNGFDERMGYGGLDRELGERLINAGVRPKQIRHRAVCVHLDHPRSYVDAAVVQHNRMIRAENCRNHSRWTPYGIYQGAELLRLTTYEGLKLSETVETSTGIRRAA